MKTILKYTGAISSIWRTKIVRTLENMAFVMCCAIETWLLIVLKTSSGHDGDENEKNKKKYIDGWRWNIMLTVIRYAV